MILGSHHKQETKDKMSEMHKGRPHTEEHKLHQSQSLKGKPCSKESIKNMIKSFTEERRKRLSECHKGKNNQFWRGGNYLGNYTNEFNNKLRNRIKKRDLYRCQVCFIHQDDIMAKKGYKRALNIHHIDLNQQNNAPNNLISLCRACHYKEHLIIH